MAHEHNGRLGSVLERTFGLPRGALGRLGGRLMAIEHRKIYSFAVEELALEPGDRVLEVGCGSGAAAALAAERATDGFVAAVDPSREMAAQTRRRLRGAIAAGRAEVAQAPAESLPFDDASSNAAFTIFSLHHWADRARGLGEVRRVLRPGGRLLVVERVGDHGHGSDQDRPEISEERIDHYLEMLGQFGFAEVECAVREVGGRKLMVLKARRPS